MLGTWKPRATNDTLTYPPNIDDFRKYRPIGTERLTGGRTKEIFPSDSSAANSRITEGAV